MKPKSIRDAVLALLALIVALMAAHWLDAATDWLSQRAKQTFDYTFALWFPALALLLFATALSALTGWLVLRATCPRAIGVIYLLAGVVAVMLFPLVLEFHLIFPIFALLPIGPLSFWTMTGAMLAAAGLFHLFRRQPVA